MRSFFEMKANVAVLVIALAAATYVVAKDIDVVPTPNGLKGSGSTTRYWDCCKPSCAWAGNLNGTKKTHPTRSCKADGDVTEGVNAVSGCETGNLGTAYMCTDQEPHVYNDTLTLAFVAASFASGGGADVSKCCTCLVLTFSDAKLKNKKLLVQVTNTGSDLSKNHFDIAIPGGGVGIFNACSNQWKAPTDGWGDRYGGVKTIEECSKLPAKLQDGCKWRFDWFGGADNPTVDFYEVNCPSELTDLSGCY